MAFNNWCQNIFPSETRQLKKSFSFDDDNNFDAAIFGAMEL